jgi:uncharacterized YigZ family protein
VNRRVAAGAAESELRELGSRFFAFVAPAADVAAAEAFVEALRKRYPDATHHCFAWRVGEPPVERSSDDGEPGGTAGAPMLQALRTAELADVVAVVVRWFGGTKLGKGGLVRAYGGAVRAALERLPVALERRRVRFVVELPFERIGAVRRLIRPPEVELASERWGERVELELAVVDERASALADALAGLGVAVRER